MIFIMLVCSIYNNVWTGNLRPMVGQISTIYKIHQNDTKLIKNNSGNIYKTHQIKHKNKKKILIKRETYN